MPTPPKVETKVVLELSGEAERDKNICTVYIEVRVDGHTSGRVALSQARVQDGKAFRDGLITTDELLARWEQVKRDCVSYLRSQGFYNLATRIEKDEYDDDIFNS